MERCERFLARAAWSGAGGANKAVVMAFGLAGAAKKSADPLAPEWLAWKHAFRNRPGAMIFLGIESTQMMFSDLNVSFWRLLLSANPVFNESSAAGGKAVHFIV